jgi:hypothetical protein
MTLIEDPNADARSLMNRAPCICDGESSSVVCKHYWSVIQKFHAQNADGLRSGEKQRACTLTEGLVLEFTSEEKPTVCNRYEARKETGLVAILKRSANALLMQPKGAGYVRFDSEFAKFNPMTVEEIAKLREQFPDRPVVWGQGKRPDMMTVADIANGPQIGILKPGEEMPGGLSEETDKALDGIFDRAAPGAEGILSKKGGDE